MHDILYSSSSEQLLQLQRVARQTLERIHSPSAMTSSYLCVVHCAPLRLHNAARSATGSTVSVRIHHYSLHVAQHEPRTLSRHHRNINHGMSSAHSPHPFPRCHVSPTIVYFKRGRKTSPYKSGLPSTFGRLVCCWSVHEYCPTDVFRICSAWRLARTCSTQAARTREDDKRINNCAKTKWAMPNSYVHTLVSHCLKRQCKNNPELTILFRPHCRGSRRCGHCYCYCELIHHTSSWRVAMRNISKHDQ